MGPYSCTHLCRLVMTTSFFVYALRCISLSNFYRAVVFEIRTLCMALQSTQGRTQNSCGTVVSLTPMRSTWPFSLGRSHFKRTHIDLQLNGLVVRIFFVLFCMCCSAAIGSSIWEERIGNVCTTSYTTTTTHQSQDFKDKLNRQSDEPAEIATLQFFSYLIVLSNLVPISLYVRYVDIHEPFCWSNCSVELIRVGQSLLIGWDIEMYHKASDTPAVARTTTLNEELGQIDYVFSDKVCYTISFFDRSLAKQDWDAYTECHEVYTMLHTRRNLGWGHPWIWTLIEMLKAKKLPWVRQM